MPSLRVWLELFITGVGISYSLCLFSCAPFVCSYLTHYKTSDTNPSRITLFLQGVRSVFFFCLGRLLAYTIMGSIAGFFYLHFINLRNTLYSLQGIFLVFLGGVMFYYAKKEDKCYISSERRGLFSFFKSTYLHFFILGLLIGSTPCLALFSILPYIFIHSTNPFIGALLGGTVGLGTLSSFLPLFIIGGVIKSYVRLKIISYLAAIFLIIWGIRLLLLQL